MKIDSHKKALKESEEVIAESIKLGLEKRQRTIGFHCSSAAIDLLEIFLHKRNLLDAGAYLKHNWFTSIHRAQEKLPQFENKEKILALLAKIEQNRSLLCYGKPRASETIKGAIIAFNKLKELLEVEDE